LEYSLAFHYYTLLGRRPERLSSSVQNKGLKQNLIEKSALFLSCDVISLSYKSA
jgi:hypothetical protein